MPAASVLTFSHLNHSPELGASQQRTERTVSNVLWEQSPRSSFTRLPVAPLEEDQGGNWGTHMISGDNFYNESDKPNDHPRTVYKTGILFIMLS